MSDGAILYKETATGRVLKYSLLVNPRVESMDTSIPAPSNGVSVAQSEMTGTFIVAISNNT